MLHEQMNVPSEDAGMDDAQWARFEADAVKTHGDRAKRRSKPVFVSMARREKWLAPMKVYIAWCEDCDLHVVSHLSGYGRVTCTKCRKQFRVMTWPRFRDKILREKVVGFWAPFLLLVASAALVAYGIHSFT